MKLREKINAFTDMIDEGKYTGRELVLAGISLFLLGVVLGFIFSPKKTTTIGSNNGSNNSGNEASLGDCGAVTVEE